MCQKKILVALVFLVNSYCIAATQQDKWYKIPLPQNTKIFLGVVSPLAIFLFCWLYKYTHPKKTKDEYLREIDCCQNYVWKNDGDDRLNFVYSFWGENANLSKIIDNDFMQNADLM